MASFKKTAISVFLTILILMACLAPAASATGGSSSGGFQLGVVLKDPAGLEAFESAIGRRTDIFLWYQAIDETLDTSLLVPVAAGGRSVQLSWTPIPAHSATPIDPAAYRLRKFARGDYDSELRRWAREIRSFGYPVLLRPMCEMNGDWTLWSGYVNGNTPADYIDAWRHMHDIFAQEGVTNVKWVWSPNRDGSTEAAVATFDNYYPGDAYVDYIGFSGYNWGTMYHTPTWISSWQGFEEVISYSYDVVAARTAKPVMISEMASTELGGDKGAWITDMFAQLPARFPRIVSLTWFNELKETDWRVESSPGSLAAFRAGIRSLDGSIGACGMPGLGLARKSTYWASYTDYRSNVLTVEFTAGNVGFNDAIGLEVSESRNSGGVVTLTPMPLYIGNIPDGGSAPVTMKYRVPSGVTVFYVTALATASDPCGTTYAYPGSYIRI